MGIVGRLSEQTERLRRYALLLCRSREDAEDLVQETLMRAIAGVSTWRPGGDLRAWLFSILHNTFATSARNYRRRALLSGLLMPEAETSVRPGQAAHVELGETIRALEQLPDEQRRAILLVSVEGMTYEEAALALGVPIGTLMSRLARGRATLRALTEREAPRNLKIVR